MLPTQCEKCNAQFLVKPSWLKAGYGKYCSPTCRRAAQRTGKQVECHQCKAAVYKSGKALKGTKSGHLFCDKSCQTKWRNVHFSNQNHANYKNGNYAYRTILLRSGAPQICNLCQTTDTRVLAAHHIDLNHSNHTVENLAWLCHNCHHLVHHDPTEYERFMAAMV